ncbi:MC/SLC25 family protein [Estrella lausannensis]|uniref:Putative membrane protein n=1 Tax=Estrella lausannensis TaxID=483423 RepID=A0A0H5DT62_9BACT|nr:MC/SLC25 family protein [Estrella lausannensis]CRX39553.1 putative membrane protein [Estrella lausannensis]
MSTQINEKQSVKPFWQDLFAGGLSGVATVGLLQPMIYYKNMSQARSIESQSTTLAGKMWTFSPRALYRGAGGFAASFAPTIALQTVANSVFANWMNPLAAAALAGAASSIVVNPAELIMIQQQKTGKSFLQTMKILVKTAGPQVFFRGLVYTAGREVAFTGAYLGLTPYMKERFKQMGAAPGPAHMAAALVWLPP